VSPASITGTVPETDFSAVANETISLVCNVEGSPAPTATWSKVGGSSPSSDRVTVNKVYDLESKLTSVEYVISGVIASDSGTYKCTAANTVNVVTKEITMTVTTGV